mgnify:CR=1 FL=1
MAERVSKSEQPVLSVVIPARNEEQKIPLLLAMLRREMQYFLEDIEIIVANNSDRDDSTASIVSDFSMHNPKMNVQIVESEKGVSKARNCGADAARSDTILFLDADTRMQEGVLRSSLASMNLADLDAAGFYFDSPTNAPLERLFVELSNGAHWVLQHTPMPVCTAAALYVKKDAHNEIGGFNEDMSFFEDSDYVQRIVRSGRQFGFVPERVVFDMSRFRTSPLHFMRIHAENVFHFMTHGVPSPSIIQEYHRNRDGALYELHEQYEKIS